MYSGYGGSPSRTLSTMSLSARPIRRLTTRSITRSQSFTGVNTYDRSYRSLSVFGTPGISRKPSRASRMFTMSTKSNPPPKVPQPERVDQVYQALHKGLQSYLQIHQTDLDSLSRQMKESKRNSRLGFLYELDKQVKVTERFIRRLEFHLSKVEELYEAYCLQRRLRDGADKMVKAYSTSSVSKEAKESLAEANKGYKEYTENMCVMENELENQLGEFHLKMKGLAGFARLCAGDQYEIFMRFGRQRWRLRGRIEINGKQVWDSEDMVFLPLINEFLSVKVTELKSLANHVVVGSVSCETKDLFAALPQSVAVDINDLGTIKLSLEVTWNPFDKDDQGSVSSSVNKVPTVNKRFSTIFNQSPPDTPSLREQAFYNMLRRHEELENGAAWSNSSESSDDSSSPQLSAGGPRSSTPQKPVIVSPEIQPATVTGSPTFCLRTSSSILSKAQKSSCEVSSIPEQDFDGGCDLHRSEEDRAAGPDSETQPNQLVSNSLNSQSFSRSLSHISEHSADDQVLTEGTEGTAGQGAEVTSELSIGETEQLQLSSAASDADTSAESPGKNEIQTRSTDRPIRTSLDQASSGPAPRKDEINSESNFKHLDPLPQSGDVTYVARLVSVEEEEASPGGGADDPSKHRDAAVDHGLEEALGAVQSSLDDYRGQFPELQALEEELKLLQLTLKGGRHSRSPSVVSLTVETALGSFDFLNAADFEEEEEERRSRNVRPLQDRGLDSAAPLTTGCTTLDRCLTRHLKHCSSQLLRLGTFGPLRCGEMFALDRLLREARVLQVIRQLSKDEPRRLRQPAEVLPELSLCLGAVSFWHQCVGQDSVYSVSADKLLRTLSTVYSSRLPQRTSSMADSVFVCLVERVLDWRLPRRAGGGGGGGGRDEVSVTLFQLWSYVEANGVTDLETHVSELAEEVWFVQKLESCDQDVIVQTLRRPVYSSLKKQGLHAVAKLLRDPRGKVSASASSVLRSLAAQPRQREQALVSCLELLEDSSVDTRVCGCKALAPLKAKESIEQLVYLCQTDKEEVREAAKQTLLVLGEEGKMAHRHVETSMDSIPRLFAPGGMASTAF